MHSVALPRKSFACRKAASWGEILVTACKGWQCKTKAGRDRQVVSSSQRKPKWRAGCPRSRTGAQRPPTHRRTPTAKAGLDLPALPASLSAWQRQIFQLTFSAVLIATISHMYVTYCNSIPPLPCSPPTSSQLIFLLLLRVCMGGGTRQLRPLCVYDCNRCTAPRRQDCIALLSRFWPWSIPSLHPPLLLTVIHISPFLKLHVSLAC